MSDSWVWSPVTQTAASTENPAMTAAGTATNSRSERCQRRSRPRRMSAAEMVTSRARPSCLLAVILGAPPDGSAGLSVDRVPLALGARMRARQGGGMYRGILRVVKQPPGQRRASASGDPEPRHGARRGDRRAEHAPVPGRQQLPANLNREDAATVTKNGLEHAAAPSRPMIAGARRRSHSGFIGSQPALGWSRTSHEWRTAAGRPR